MPALSMGAVAVRQWRRLCSGTQCSDNKRSSVRLKQFTKAKKATHWWQGCLGVHWIAPAGKPRASLCWRPGSTTERRPIGRPVAHSLAHLGLRPAARLLARAACAVPRRVLPQSAAPPLLE